MPTYQDFSKLTLPTVIFFSLWASCLFAQSKGDQGNAETQYSETVKPLLEEFCYGCHGDGGDEGGLELDRHEKWPAMMADLEMWQAVWKNVRAQTMPPSEEEQPTDEQRDTIMRWIASGVFRVDPKNPDPGRVTVRRLNREEYTNSIKDLLDVDFDSKNIFPPDNTGYGFDTVGDALSISPLLMEKYLSAAETIVAEAVTSGDPKTPEIRIDPKFFKNKDRTAIELPFAEHSTVVRKQLFDHPGPYKVSIRMKIRGQDTNASDEAARISFLVGDKEVCSRDVGWDNERLSMRGTVDIPPGESELKFRIEPKREAQEDVAPLHVEVYRIELKGPTDGSYLIYPDEYYRVFVDGPPPTEAEAKRKYARKLLSQFARRAFRRSVPDPYLDRLVEFSMESVENGKDSFEQGVSKGMVAILSSPRFIFRTELQPQPDDPGKVVELGEFALASRLSYFLWSSIPDDELLELAEKKQLRKKLDEQIDRLLDDERSNRFIENFVGQWLRTRDVRSIHIEPKRILSRDDRKKYPFTNDLRRDMAEETQQFFAYLLREDRPLTELLTADYSIINNRLAKYYDIDGVDGREFRKVDFGQDSHRRGLLSHGSMLVVTSNPTRTSPVKRGLFVLDNLLGTPAPPAPPDVPELEDVKNGDHKDATMRELMELHREAPLCASCHARMDPIGLALENYNAMGIWRGKQNDKEIDASGVLMTGESFENAADLATILATERKSDLLRCITEKVLTYALGRGLEYYDLPTVDKIVERLESGDGSAKQLIRLVVRSPAFQKRRGDGNPLEANN
ncbi:MAG: DUF1592 domain-containing protein, partial [Planctomycetota bacterium]